MENIKTTQSVKYEKTNSLQVGQKYLNGKCKIRIRLNTKMNEPIHKCN